jgi:ketosteroid isomerase-like protein
MVQTGGDAMGKEAKNVEALKTAYKTWHDTKGGSVDHWMTMIADDIKFGSLAGGAPRVAFTTSYTNKQALKGYFDGLLSGWDMIHYTTDEFIAQGESVVMRGSTAWRSKQTGKVCETPKLDYWRFRDGKAVEYFEYYDTAGLHAAATP